MWTHKHSTNWFFEFDFESLSLIPNLCLNASHTVAIERLVRSSSPQVLDTAVCSPCRPPISSPKKSSLPAHHRKRTTNCSPKPRASPIRLNGRSPKQTIRPAAKPTRLSSRSSTSGVTFSHSFLCTAVYPMHSIRASANGNGICWSGVSSFACDHGWPNPVELTKFRRLICF